MTTLPTLSLKYETNMLAGSDTRNNRNYNWSELENKYSALGSYLQGIVDGYDLRINNMIANSTKTDEVVDARMDVHENTYATLKARLDAEQEATPEIMDTGNISDAMFLLKVNDLSSTASTEHIYYTNATKIDDVTLPAMGYSECSASKISYTTIATLS